MAKSEAFFSLPFSCIAKITESPNRFAPPGPGIARGSRRLLEIASRKYSGDYGAKCGHPRGPSGHGAGST